MSTTPSPVKPQKQIRSRLSLAILISVVVHFVLLIVLGLWTVYRYVQEGDPGMEVAMEQGEEAEAPQEVVEEVEVTEVQPEVEIDLDRLTVDPLHDVALPEITADTQAVPTPPTPTIPTTAADRVAFRQAMPRGDWANSFGSREESEFLLRGFYYDFKRKADGGHTSLRDRDHFPVIREYIENNFDQSVLDEYFRVPDPLFTSFIFHPRRNSTLALEAYEAEEHGVSPGTWAVHYTGRFSPPESGKYRFITKAEAGMVVIVDREVVSQNGYGSDHQITSWRPSERYNFGLPGNSASVGDWLELRSGQNYDIEIFLGDGQVGNYQAILLIEQEGVDYEKDSRGNPILPIFAMVPMEGDPPEGFGEGAMEVQKRPLSMPHSGGR
ncbi:MAG: hypothetical protein LAT55_06250 [Opitutales bacterium]|nr:hypothetical protein [Opitutales bacterium]